MDFRKIVLALVAGLALGPALTAVPAAPLRITGWAQAATGAPLPAGRAELFPLFESREQALRRLEGQRPVPLVAADLGPDGAFELTAPGAGFYRVVVRADGHRPLYRDLLPLVEETPLPAVELYPESPAELRLIGPSGLPLAGVDLEVELLAGRIVPRPWLPVLVDGVSDAEGRVGIAELGTAFAVRLFHPRFLGTVRAPAGLGAVQVPRSRPRLLVVRDAGGQPVPRALVRWRGRPVAATGPAGRVSVALPPPGEPPLWVEGPDGSLAPVAGAGDEKAPLEVRFQALEEVTGRVVDSARRPVPGAWVWPDAFPGAMAAVRSDAEGRFRLRLPAASRNGRLWAAAAGHLPLTAALAPAELVLRPAAVISGRAVDAAGKPVAGARIRLASPANERSEGIDPGVPEARTAADGAFRLPGLLPNGVYELDATQEELARTRMAVRTAPAGRATPPVRLVFGQGQTALGRVVDAAGRPVAGAEVLLQAPREPGGEVPRAFRAEADAAGAFRIRRVVPGVYTLLVRKRGLSSLVRPDVRIPPRSPEVALGTLELPQGAAIEGRVTDLQGRPVAGAQVYCVSSQPLPGPGDGSYDLWPTPGPLHTGADGAFRFDGLPRGDSFHLVVMHPRYAPARLPGIEAPTPSPLRVELDRGRVLSGRVVGPDREPVAGASLERVEYNEVRHDSGSSASGTSERLGQTDAEGRFEIPGRSAGILDVQVVAPEYRPRLVKGVRIPAAGDPPPLEIVLDRGVALEGRVLEEDGRPVAGAHVSAGPADGQYEEDDRRGPDWAVTGAEGEYRIAGLRPAGGYHVQANAADGRIARTQAAPGVYRVDLRFPAGAEVSGRVEEVDGTPLPGAAVDLAPLDGGNILIAVAAPDGSFRFPNVAAGRHRITARHRGYVDVTAAGQVYAPQELEVGGAAVQGVLLRLTRSRLAILGQLQGLSREEQLGTRIEAYGPGQPARVGVADGSGGYQILDLVPGEWHVSAVTAAGERSASGSARVDAETPEVILDLDFNSRFTLTGRVRLDRQPLVDAGLNLTNAEGNHPGRTSHDGSFRIGGIAPGSYTLVIQAPARGLSHAVPVVLDAREGDRDLTVEIETGSLSGRVTSEAGEPLADAVVQLTGLQPGAGLSFSGPAARTGPDGGFALPAVASGPYRATIRKEGFAPVETEITVRPGASEILEVVLAPAGTS